MWPLSLRAVRGLMGSRGLRSVAAEARPALREGLLVPQRAPRKRNKKKQQEPPRCCWQCHPGVCRSVLGDRLPLVIQVAAELDKWTTSQYKQQNLESLLLDRRFVRIWGESADGIVVADLFAYVALTRLAPRTTVFCLLCQVRMDDMHVHLKFATEDQAFVFHTTPSLLTELFEVCEVTEVRVRPMQAADPQRPPQAFAEPAFLRPGGMPQRSGSLTCVGAGSLRLTGWR